MGITETPGSANPTNLQRFSDLPSVLEELLALAEELVECTSAVRVRIYSA